MSCLSQQKKTRKRKRNKQLTNSNSNKNIGNIVNVTQQLKKKKKQKRKKNQKMEKKDENESDFKSIDKKILYFCQERKDTQARDLLLKNNYLYRLSSNVLSYPFPIPPLYTFTSSDANPPVSKNKIMEIEGKKKDKEIPLDGGYVKAIDNAIPTKLLKKNTTNF